METPWIYFYFFFSIPAQVFGRISSRQEIADIAPACLDLKVEADDTKVKHGMLP
jgi:hypothetical protein